MRLTPERLLDDFNYFGFLFESLCDRDLRIYAESIDGQVFHYRDASGLEADAAVHLCALKEKVNTEKMREPSFLMILTGTELAYRREDGVFVIPIGCLKN